MTKWDEFLNLDPGFGDISLVWLRLFMYLSAGYPPDSSLAYIIHKTGLEHITTFTKLSM